MIIASLLVTDVIINDEPQPGFVAPYYYLLDEKTAAAFKDFEGTFYDFLHTDNGNGLWEDQILNLAGTTSLIDYIKENPEVEITGEFGEIAPEGCQTIIFPDREDDEN